MREDKFINEPYPLNRIQEYREKKISPQGFKILHLDLLDHPYLGTVQIELVNSEEFQNGLYTTLIIGPNGSGKSYLLTTIVNIFRQLKSYDDDKNTSNHISGGFNMIFTSGGDFYSFGNIVYNHINRDNTVARARRIDGRQNVLFKINGKESGVNPAKLPKKILASSSMLWDKFPFLSKKSSFLDHYDYLGIRSSGNSAGTRDLVRKTVYRIVDNIYGKKLVPNLRELMSFLGYDGVFKISFVPKYRTHFWNQNLNYEQFCRKFENWKETFPNRQTPPWGLNNFNKVKNDRELISKMLVWMNNVELKPYGRGGRYLDFDVLNDSSIIVTFEYIKLLTKLDLLHPPEITFYKNGQKLSMNTSSSGERQIITSLIGILSSLEDNSVVLIDEPEVSLHPNWQMKYMHILRKMFSHFDSCHFIVASHSHFMVSDSENEVSHVIGVDRETDIIKDKNNDEILKIVSNMTTVPSPSDAYGWSAEEVLLKIFKTPTTRNYFVAEKIGSILDAIAKPEKDLKAIKKGVIELQENNLDKLSSEDPLKEIVDKLLEKYG